MKKIKILIFVLILMIVLIPTFSVAADFACPSCGIQYGGGAGNRGLGAIWHAMRIYGDAWLDTDIGDHTGTWEADIVPHGLDKLEGEGAIHSRGGICFGHLLHLVRIHHTLKLQY